MRVISVCFGALSLALMASSQPTQANLAPRSYASDNGALTCYYTCPVNGANQASTGVTPGGMSSDTTCTYPGGGTCEYSPNGALIVDNDSGNCPGTADFAGCQPAAQAPPAGGFRKRRVSTKKRTTAQKIIAARQFNPKTTKSKRSNKARQEN